MSRRSGYARKARNAQQRYSNRAGPVQIRRQDQATAEAAEPLPPSALARIIADGNDTADPRYRSHRRTWSPPGS